MSRRSSSGQLICCTGGRCDMPDAPWHGTSGGSGNHACRCAPCTEAQRVTHAAMGSQARYRARLLAGGRTFSAGTPLRQKPYIPRGGADLRQVDPTPKAPPKREQRREICGGCWLEIPASGQHECDAA